MAGVERHLAPLGLEVATSAEYEAWLGRARPSVPAGPGCSVRLGVIGGRLQGTEAAYLAREAGYEVVLVDRMADVPATGLVDEVHVFDVMADEERARRLAHVLRRRPAGVREPGHAAVARRAPCGLGRAVRIPPALVRGVGLKACVATGCSRRSAFPGPGRGRSADTRWWSSRAARAAARGSW